MMSDSTLAAYINVLNERDRLRAERVALRHALEWAEAALCQGQLWVGGTRDVREMILGAIAECREALAGMAEGEVRT